MPKQLISEQSIVEAAKRGQRTLACAPDAIITAAARDKAQALGVKLIRETEEAAQTARRDESEPKRDGEIIAIGSDHGGFQLKEIIKPFIASLGYKLVDVGTYSEEPCDYPDYAFMVARMVSLGEASKGIMIDAVGVASAMVANKVPGVRAACCHSEFTAQSSREHNDANVLTLGGRVTGHEVAKAIVRIWLQTWFGGGRHKARVDKISEVERRFLK